ncbi:allophanate hydrolase [Xenorhabdus szentirmaii]|uniref:Allophanate hydrolase n=1 Tax=Xenorhabdus szentirmaii DSM 16338 TaxID=1427518 RepID=W1IX24_9GAMM|nr:MULTISPECIES: allophanate hydrolase [Xenorhabdus]MBD2804696.1 allophanate hydrolase [Xenorhabdus sp. ZM]PHM34931.1 putative multifunctional urea amidolyase [Xenorhabdus szentirmaii DSM 16338]PHM43688.1 putative multifunctional urea amidolyase [Xenorhabdus szentirmaii]CDL82373.1 Allophanate hydrolase [Xenorhabdus szentirmaii DSM 16338]
MTPIMGYTLKVWQDRIQENTTALFALLQQHVNSFLPGDNAWIYLATPEQLKAQIDEIIPRYQQCPDNLPLFGIPFAVKDNIDVAGWPTTAACQAFEYIADGDATAVARLKAAGAIVVGKTNLDQFATGLVGTRSPFGAVRNSFNGDYVSGGSSSGSAIVVAKGLVPFALGTDTAGSGRVPASFNNIVGLKPTKGWLSRRGVVPACQLNDTLSVFALTVEDAFLVASLAGGFDNNDAYSRINPASTPAILPEHPVLAIPENPDFCGDKLAAAAWLNALAELKTVGATLQPIDFSPFAQLSKQLYQSAWVAERTTVVGDILNCPEYMEPVVHQIISGGKNYSAVEAFKAEYLRAELARKIHNILIQVDALVVPTSPTIRTIDEIEQEPILYNAELGTYTNFTNLADLSALALPAPFRADGLPAGITLIAPAWHDRALASFGIRWQRHLALPLGAINHPFNQQARATLPDSDQHVRVAVVGAHLRGMPLNDQLVDRNAVFIEATQTATHYRLYALANTHPAKPGLVRVVEGAAIDIELWDIPLARFGEFVAEIPFPLGIGSLELIDGRWVKGFICEPDGLKEATDITEFGGWRNWLTSLGSKNV